MSDVEENNFEGRVSTKPREPSSAAARCAGFRPAVRGRGLRGVLRGPRKQPPEPSRLLPHIPRWLLGSTASQALRITLRPLLETAWYLDSGVSLRPARSPPRGFPISVPSCGSPSRWGGGPRPGVSPGRTVVGADCGGVAATPELRRGSRGPRRAGLSPGREQLAWD